MVRFSVVVPLYNKELYVSRTIRSVLSQTFKGFELIVVDDGSIDCSYDVVQKELEGHPECRVVRQDNGGVAVARNHGAALAEGEFVCFLDSDDWWEPTFLEEMDQLISLYPEAGMYGSGFYMVKNNRKRVAPIGVNEDFRQGYINYCQTYARTLCMPVSSSSVAIPREVFQASGGFRKGLTIGEDFDLWIRLALKYRVALVIKPLSNYCQDVPVGRRATRRIHNPKNHMLWNLEYLAEEESQNEDLKILLDRLRANGLYRYYLSRQYHEMAVAELSKIDWSHVSSSIYRKYHTPLQLERIRFRIRVWGSATKSFLKKLVR